VKRWITRFVAALAILLASMPPAFILTIALMPLWSRIEATYGIESVGHSGPANWCFELTYVGVVLIVAGAAIAFQRRRLRGT
jgi:hypothetical protein